MARLTPREREVLALIATGRMNKQIAAELGAAEQTIKQHRGRVMRKLGVQSVAELVRLVERDAGPSATPDTSSPKPGGGPAVAPPPGTEPPVIRR
jgi:DNA-binding CsgD family transcriptional regulator